MTINITDKHPGDDLIRADRLPHIWCPGCGLGNIISAYAKAVRRDSSPPHQHAIISGIGCSGRAAGYIDLDSYHTTHGRAIAFATGLKLSNKDLKVSVISGDGDLTTIGGNHLIHAARRNIDITVILNNNFIYGMTGGQYSATTPQGAYSSTSKAGNFERPFNVSLLMKGAGATFIARWTALHVKQLTKSIENAFEHKGFSFIEVVSPCPTGFGRHNSFKTAYESMSYYYDKAVLDDTVTLQTAGLEMDPDKNIAVGEFYLDDLQDYDSVRLDFLRKQEGRS